MPDIREHLRRIETSTPPDLWTEIERRAAQERPEGEPSVIVFRPRGAEVRRRVGAGLVAAAVLALTVVVLWDAFRAAPRLKQPGDQLPDGWVQCTNASVGYSIGYPGIWHTTDILNGEQDPTYACQWFSPDPFGPEGNVVSEGWGYPLELAIRGPFDQVREQELDPEVVDVHSQDELVVEGHRAIRVEFETVIDLVGDTGLHYEYLIELDPDTTLIVHTTATRDVVGVYAENKVIVDRAVDTLRFAGETPDASPAG
jgi:hypothetical protein